MNGATNYPGMMRDMIRVAGWRLIEPAALPSLLPSHEWHEDTCMGACDEQRVMILPLLLAKNPGRGAFRRLVTRLRADGWSVCVLLPGSSMRAICMHMGFEQDRINGYPAMLLMAPAEAHQPLGVLKAKDITSW